MALIASGPCHWQTSAGMAMLRTTGYKRHKKLALIKNGILVNTRKHEQLAKLGCGMPCLTEGYLD
eukprot:364040-Chlamydomonas_euryale.AAC.5